MSGTPPTQELLASVARGDAGAVDLLLPHVYDQLHRLAAAAMKGERPDHTLQATALVNEAYLRLVGQSQVDWKGRAHFLGVAAQMIRRVLVDHARQKAAEKRGGRVERVTLSDRTGTVGPDGVDLLALHEALDELDRLNSRHRQVIELRFFGGLTEEEAAQVLGVTAKTARQDWRIARAWLQERLGAAN
jgi:RNA polymerase sigma factor (TIGR02999 family)